LDPESIRDFTRALIADLRVLERLLERGDFDDARRIGAEQELFLVDSSFRPAPVNIEVLDALSDERFTRELARFNLEINVPPKMLGGPCFSQLERELDDLIAATRAAAGHVGAQVVLTGILPTLTKSDLNIANITPDPRYHALNEATNRLREGPYRLHIEGVDELRIEHDSVMLESCNTSFQVHLQVHPDEFAQYYNVAQAITAPVLAVSVNSPFFFHKRLWEETRIALFQQAIDTRQTTPHARELSPRVRFGDEWVRHSVLEAFREGVARFPVLVSVPDVEDSLRLLDAGTVPRLQALQLFNSTVYSWNRPCYGVTGGVPHLRIECRALPAGPSVVDEIANAVLWIGAVLGAAKEYGDITSQMEFGDARANFGAAARYGLRAGMSWIGGATVSAADLVRSQIVPLARQGLLDADVDSDDVDRYLRVIEERVAVGQTGARWMARSYRAMASGTTPGEPHAALVAATIKNQTTGRPVHEWGPARLDEAGGWEPTYARVEQYMSTDLCTVRENELVDMVALVMDQKQLRHVLVENHRHELVGIVSYRSLIRLIARGGRDYARTEPVREIMERHPVTITPDTSSVDAIQLMRVKRVSALPVLQEGKLVGLVNELSFMRVAQGLLAERLREIEPTSPPES
jgi:CBS domain-containing protein